MDTKTIFESQQKLSDSLISKQGPKKVLSPFLSLLNQIKAKSELVPKMTNKYEKKSEEKHVQLSRNYFPLIAIFYAS